MVNLWVPAHKLKEEKKKNIPQSLIQLSNYAFLHFCLSGSKEQNFLFEKCNLLRKKGVFLQIFGKDNQHSGRHYRYTCSWTIMQSICALAMDIFVFSESFQIAQEDITAGRIAKAFIRWKMMKEFFPPVHDNHDFK